MKPERIQATLAPTLPATPTPPWGSYRTFQFDSLAKAENFAEFVEDMADNHGRAVTCLTDSRSYDLTVLAADDIAIEENAAQTDGARKFLGKVAGIHREWDTPIAES